MTSTAKHNSIEVILLVNDPDLKRTLRLLRGKLRVSVETEDWRGKGRTRLRMQGVPKNKAAKSTVSAIADALRGIDGVARFEVRSWYNPWPRST